MCLRENNLALALVLLVIIIAGCVFVNRLPVWSAIEDFTRNIGSLLEIDLTDYCSDPDGDELSSVWSAAPGYNGSNYSWTVSGAIGTREVEIEASDGEESPAQTSRLPLKVRPTLHQTLSPSDNAINQNFLLITLSWEGGDPDRDEVTYDLYFGKTPDPALFKEEFSSTSHTKSALGNSTKYYWKIVAKDGAHKVEGPVWSSTTGAFCLVQESFESLTLGPLSSSTLSWVDYQKVSTLFAEIT